MTNPTKLHSTKLRLAALAVLSLEAILPGMVATPAAQGQTFKVLHTFTGGVDGGTPFGQPVVDNQGDVVGTTYFGGMAGCGDYEAGCGTLWKYSSHGKFSVLHTFDSTDGDNMYAGVKLDQDGNMFGTTYEGGSNIRGTAFEITSAGTFITLYDFGSPSSDPRSIAGGITLDSTGNLYGTSDLGGVYDNKDCYYGCGTVWKLSSGGTLTVLHRFDWNDGAYPVYGDVKLDKQGNLYGVTNEGGSNGVGTLFEITAGGRFRVLYNFGEGSVGCTPSGGLRESAGVLYGTTQSCGSGGRGTVWQYDTGSSKYTVLHSFSGPDGGAPVGGVGCEKNEKSCGGNLFGTTANGGAHEHGTVWEIDSSGKFRTLHDFTNSEGSVALDRPFVGKNGKMYGTTRDGGNLGFGTLWELKASKTWRR